MNVSMLSTPVLLLDETRLASNLARVRAAVAAHAGVQLRAHLKTVKSIEIAERILRAAGGAAVSTLREAEYFLAGGVTNLLYAVSITPDKFARVGDLVAAGANMTVVLDDMEIADSVARWFTAARKHIHVLMEIDCDGHRCGVDPESSELISIARVLDRASGVDLAGVMTHAGASYECKTIPDIIAMAERERSCAVRAARRIRDAGIACANVSIGSTPTILLARTLDGVTEARVGVAFFNDLTMVGLGVCAAQDIALSVLATVIGHQVNRQQLIVDAGWTALSSDRGHASQRVFEGYGVVADSQGRVVGDLGVVATNQEHGIIASASGVALEFERFPIGSRVRILPNHACATAAAFAEYHVHGSDGRILTRWQRCSGW
jgi:D-serine deaminase-like pyridoxal phosphate-dependent protein